MVLASVTELTKVGLTVEVAASHVFETAWNFLMLFADITRNRYIPRKLFGGVVWGILRMGNQIDLAPYLIKTIMAPKFPPFLFVTGGKPEAEIKRLVREWTSLHNDQAKMVLAEVRQAMAEGRMSSQPPPLSQMVAEAIFYALMAKVPFVFKVGITMTLE